jgi:molybdenum cofactor cytidylyltransferase
MTENNRQVAGILLAAGGSSRLGEPKQLINCEGVTLLRRAVLSMAGAGCYPIVVVLGADAERCRGELRDLDLHIVINEDWRSGMSSSIKASLKCVLDIAPASAAVLIALADQLAVDTADLTLLIRTFTESEANIAAAGYGGTAGVPAVFSKRIFDRLFDLEGDRGARMVIRDDPSAVIVPMPNAAYDIDTPPDLERMRQLS